MTRTISETYLTQKSVDSKTSFLSYILTIELSDENLCLLDTAILPTYLFDPFFRFIAIDYISLAKDVC
jgi:hypothetical protein